MYICYSIPFSHASVTIVDKHVRYH